MRFLLDEIVPDLNWQTRNQLNEENVERLMEALKNGATLPPVLLYKQDEDHYTLVDGFHRYEANKRLGHSGIDGELFEGERIEALAEGVSRNMQHGLQLLKEDLKKAARMLYVTRPAGGLKGIRPKKGESVVGSLLWVAKNLGVSRDVVKKWVNPKTQQLQIERHKKNFRKVKRYDELGEEAIQNLVLDRLGSEAFKKDYSAEVRWAADPIPRGAPGTPMFLISDWHYGERVDPEQVFNSNRYNTEIAERRFRHTLEVGVSLLKQHLARPQYPGVVLILGGDMINGELHEEDVAGNEIPPLVQVHEASKIVADGVAFLAAEFPHVTVYGVPGNHGRTSRKPWAKFYAQRNMDWLLYKLVEDFCRHLTNVTFNFPPVRDITFSVAGHRYRLTHGDQFRGGDGIIGALGPIIRGDVRKRVMASMMPGQPETYDTLLCGHFHQYTPLPRVIVNGSIKGYDEFAHMINVPWEPPTQALWTVHPRHAHTWHMPLYCDEDYSARVLQEVA